MNDTVEPPSPLPLLDFLQALQEAGVPIGVREHLAVGRLINRWDVPDAVMLRSSLSALLARNGAEAALVKQTFDRVYGEPAAQPAAPPPSQPGFSARLKTRWGAWGAAVLLVSGLLTYAWVSMHPAPVLPPTPPPVLPVDASPPPPQTTRHDVPRRVVNWRRALPLAGAAGAVVFILLYRRRTRRQAQRHALRVWSEEQDRQPGPLGYDIVAPDLQPPYPPGLLDDVSVILGRHAAPAQRGDEMDVDRSVAATLRAGLAPQIVWRVRVASLPILVLEDVSDEMVTWRRRVDALLEGLRVRGVALDHWRFEGDASRLFRGPEEPATLLRLLARRSADNPLLIVSTGAGVLDGEALHTAGWIDVLRHWRSRAWLHPVADRRYWRRALVQVPVEMWPMTFEGVVAAARQLSRGESRMGERAEPRARAERRVSPLDVERLRWLVSLAPRRDPILAELLRQRFCPHVPSSALVEALASPPGTEPPPVGPDAEEVHAYLADVLAASRPRQEGTAAHDRGRVDQALQWLGAGRRDSALDELKALGRGAAAPLVVDAVQRLAPLTPAVRDAVRPDVERRVVAPLRARAREVGWRDAASSGAHRWTRPRWREVGAGLVAAAALLGASPRLGPVTHDVLVPANEVYVLSSSEPAAIPGLKRTAFVPGPFVLTLRRRDGVSDDSAIAPRTAQMLQDGSVRGEISEGGPDLRMAVGDRGHWFQAQAKLRSGTLAVSNLVWVPREASSGWLQVVVLDEAGSSLGAGPAVEITDGRRTVTSPAGARLPVPIGDWTVRVAVPGYVPEERRVTVDGGTREQPVQEVVRLVRVASPTPAPVVSPSAPAPRPGYLRVTYPSSSAVPGVPFDVTPQGSGSPLQGRTGKDLQLPPGRWTVSISRPLGVVSRTAEIREGQLTTVDLGPPAADAPGNDEVQQGPPVEPRDAEPVYAQVGCEEERLVQIVYALRRNEQYVDASVEVVKASNLKDQQVVAVQYDPKAGTVTGGVRIRGLDRRLLSTGGSGSRPPVKSCPGGGNVTVGMRVRVRLRTESQAY